MRSHLPLNDPQYWFGLDDGSAAQDGPLAPDPVAAGALLAGSTTTSGPGSSATQPVATRSASGGAAIGLAAPSVLAGTNQTIAFSSLFNVGSSSGNPTYLIVSGLDRNEYTTGYSTSGMGHLSGGGRTQTFSNYSGDAWSASVVFTYQPSTGQYVNSAYGALSQLSFVTGSNRGDLAAISVFGTNNASQATQYASDPITMALNPAAFTNYGSVDVLTGAAAANAPASATPGSVVAAANSYVGAAWNDSGCWVLASDIAAKAGATLPLTSTAAGVPGVPNGEWFVAYDGPVSANSNWVNSLTAGEMVSFVTSSGGGHITTVASGQGASAQLIDNITYVDARGNIYNAANDGSANDVIVQAPHAASQEFTGVNAANVVVYELDTPVVADTVASLRVTAGTNVSLAGDFTASDPKPGDSITQYQVYETNSADTLTVSGSANSNATSAAGACTLGSLSGLGLTGGTPGSDTVEVRAFNGSYWGDWTALNVTVGSSAPAIPASNVSVATALASGSSGPVNVTDTAANIGAHADQLQSLAAAGRLTGVTVAGGGLVSISAAQLASDQNLLSLLPRANAVQVSGATATQAASVQANAQVSSFTLTDVAANVTAAHTALASDSKLTMATVNGTTGADTLDMTGMRMISLVNLNGDTATARGGFSASPVNLTAAPDAVSLGSGFTILTAGMQGAGVTTISNFQFGMDTLELNLGSLHSVNAVNTTLNGAHAIAITGGSMTEGIVLLNQPSSVTAATINSHIYNLGSMALVF